MTASGRPPAGEASRTDAAAREAAARHAVARICGGMRVGFGSGRTVDCAIEALGERARAGLRVQVVVASSRSEAAARRAGLETVDLALVEALDLAIDGADEADPQLNLIKGGGGALVREKLLAAAAAEVLIAAEASKRVERLGRFPLPVAILPYGAPHTLRRLARLCPAARLRESGGRPFVTDDGLWIADLPLGEILDPPALERELKSVLGVVESGLFCGVATRLLLGREDGSVSEHLPE